MINAQKRTEAIAKMTAKIIQESRASTQAELAQKGYSAEQIAQDPTMQEDPDFQHFAEEQAAIYYDKEQLSVRIYKKLKQSFTPLDAKVLMANIEDTTLEKLTTIFNELLALQENSPPITIELLKATIPDFYTPEEVTSINKKYSGEKLAVLPSVNTPIATNRSPSSSSSDSPHSNKSRSHTPSPLGYNPKLHNSTTNKDSSTTTGDERLISLNFKI